MKAMAFRDNSLVVTELADPVPGPDQALIRVRACGVCGSDLHFVHHASHVVETSNRIPGAARIDLSRDIILGHEFCGELLDRTGALAAGTLVCSIPFATTGDTATSLGFSAELQGGYGELMVLDKANLLPVTNGVDAVRASLTEPLAVGWHAVQRARLNKRDVALVLGCGPIGLAVIAALRVEGIRPIVAADFNPDRREAALAMGADVVIDPRERSPYETWAELARDTAATGDVASMVRPTVIFECVGLPGMLARVFDGAVTGTRVIVVGVCMEKDSFEPLFPLNKELDVHFSFYYSAEEFAQSLKHIVDGVIDVTPMMTGTIGLEKLPDAFERASASPSDIKITVDPSGVTA